MTTVFQIDPLSDPRWDPFVLSHPWGGVFHCTGWLRALRETYGFRPIVVTTSAADQPLQNGIVLCEINSFLTGRRLVSLPFSDHCDPLINSAEEMADLIAFLNERLRREKLRYVELRPFMADVEPSDNACLTQGDAFVVHTVRLDLPLEDLFRNTHKDCIQRQVRRFERDGLGYAEGRSFELISQFYQLMIKTRRRHALPPQPLSWFHNLGQFMGEQLLIRVAYFEGKPIASTLSLAHNKTLTYKYSCSDEQFSNRSATAYLVWKSIEHAKSIGLQTLDLGRSAPNNQGLVKFKDRFGAERSLMHYFRMSQAERQPSQYANWLNHAAKRAVSYLPDSVLEATGRLLYRHMG